MIYMLRYFHTKRRYLESLRKEVRVFFLPPAGVSSSRGGRRRSLALLVLTAAGELVRRAEDPCGPQLAAAAAEKAGNGHTGRAQSLKRAHTHTLTHTHSPHRFPQHQHTHTHTHSLAEEDTGAGLQQTVSCCFFFYIINISFCISLF